LKPAWDIGHKILSQKPITKKAGGVVQDIGPELKPSTTKKKKKKERKERWQS
jgi:hypothetical protein